MPNITIEDIAPPSFNRIDEEGDYKVTVTRAEWKPGAKSYFLLTLENDDEETILTEVYVTKESKWRLQEVLFALDIVKRGQIGASVRLEAESFMHRAAQVEVKLDKWIDKNTKEEKSKLKVSKWWCINESKPSYDKKKQSNQAPVNQTESSDEISL